MLILMMSGEIDNVTLPRESGWNLISAMINNSSIANWKIVINEPAGKTVFTKIK